MEHTSKRHEGTLLVYMIVTRSPSGEGKKGTCGKDQPYHTGAPGHLSGVLTACLWGYWGSRKI